MGASMSSERSPWPLPSSSSYVSRCDANHVNNDLAAAADGKTTPTDMSTSQQPPPPAMHRPQSFEEKVYEKFRKQPLVPIGCAATAYFLASGIKSFQRQDPRRGQKMMRARVAAQFATLGVFMWYIGFDRINFGVAPQYHAAKRAREEYAKQMEQEGK